MLICHYFVAFAILIAFSLYETHLSAVDFKAPSEQRGPELPFTGVSYKQVIQFFRSYYPAPALVIAKSINVE